VIAGLIGLWLIFCLGVFVLWLGWRIVDWLMTPGEQPPDAQEPDAPVAKPLSKAARVQAAIAEYEEEKMLCEVIDDPATKAGALAIVARKYRQKLAEIMR
jgi:hypothetical protein